MAATPPPFLVGPCYCINCPVLMSPWRMDVKWYMKCYIHWTADLKSSKLLSSQLRRKFSGSICAMNCGACRSKATVLLLGLGLISLRLSFSHFIIFLSDLEQFLSTYREATSLSNALDLGWGYPQYENKHTHCDVVPWWNNQRSIRRTG